MITETQPTADVRKEYEGINASWLQRHNTKIDWVIEERNKPWHDLYFTQQAVHDHQAKGSCRLAWMVLAEMEKQKWIDPKSTAILDPMCGIGSFLIVAALKSYNAVGIELEKRFYDDMVGTDGFIEVDDDEDLFAGVGHGKSEGTISRFHNLASSLPHAGRIQVIQGDARFTDDILLRVDPDGYRYWEGGLGIICSPPYGNRLADEKQRFSSKDSRTMEELQADSDRNRQYSNDSDNIGTCKIAVLNSPPYSRSTEHSNGQMDAFKTKPITGHRGFQYTNRQNIAMLKDSAYNREMQKVYNSLYRALPVGSPVALITRNFIQKSQVILLDELTTKLMNHAGFTYQFIRRATLPDISFFKFINWQKVHKKKKLPLITWEEVTFYRKLEL